jgi:hypothetical protein
MTLSSNLLDLTLASITVSQPVGEIYKIWNPAKMSVKIKQNDYEEMKREKRKEKDNLNKSGR